MAKRSSGTGGVCGGEGREPPATIIKFLHQFFNMFYNLNLNNLNNLNNIINIIIISIIIMMIIIQNLFSGGVIRGVYNLNRGVITLINHWKMMMVIKKRIKIFDLAENGFF